MTPTNPHQTSLHAARSRYARRTALTAIAAFTLAASALALTACQQTSAKTASGKPSIIATTTQVADFVRALVGDQASVTQLIQPGQSAHSFDPSAAQLAALGSASALVTNGAGLDTWINAAVKSSGFTGIRIDASKGIELKPSTEEEDEPEQSQPAANPSPSASAGEHEHTEAVDPHIWTDPKRAAQMVRTIATDLGRLSLDSGKLNAASTSYLAKLADLDNWIHQNIDPVPVATRLLVTNHDAFTYFVDAFKVTLVGSVIPSFDDHTEPSAAQIDELVAKIKETGVKVVFAETSISPKTADTIATAANVKVYSGDDALYGDSLGAAGSDGATYLSSQVHNIRLIVSSWGVTASAPPASLNG